MYSRRQTFTCALLLAGVVLPGCVEEDIDQHEPLLSSDEADPATELVDEIDHESQAIPYNFPTIECSSHNVIGVLDRGGDCSLGGASLPNWQWHTMFEDFTPDLTAWTEPLPYALTRYCIFEYVGPGEPNPESFGVLFSAIAAYPSMSLDSVAPDCRGEVVQGEGLNDPAVVGELAKAFHDAIQWVPGAVLAPTRDNRRPVEVAIVDTVSQLAHDDSSIDPVNMHGEFMGDIVRDIACADPDDKACSDAIRFHIAMPREEKEFADWEHGGEFGTMGDFAMSIVAAVGQWRQSRLSDPKAPQRLVISASLGWVPEAPVTEDPNRGPVRALEEALYFASCNGALVFAAAGNVTNASCGAGETDPLAPAVYELVDAPTKEWCMLRGYLPIDDQTYPVFGNPRPLVNAVGGVDGFDRPIVNARPDGMPGLAAYAANATVVGAKGFTTPLTGTSVSTAVVAGIAGLVWSYAPELRPDQVMKVIRGAAYETDLHPDFSFNSGSVRVVRASVCAALRETCAVLPAGHCPELACDDPRPPHDGHLSGYFDAVETAVADPDNAVEVIDPVTGTDPVCVAPTWDEQIDPQPEHPMCPSCGLDSPPPPDGPNNDVLTMTIASQYKGSIVSGMLITFDASNTATTFVFSQKLLMALNEPDTRIVQVNYDAPGTVAAVLSFTLADGSVQDGPIPVKN